MPELCTTDKERRLERKKFLLRLPSDLWDDIQRLAAADLRSVNSEIEVLLKEALRRRGVKNSGDKEGESDSG